MSTLIVTGGAGFIGSNLIQKLIATTPFEVVCIDVLSYAGDKSRISNLLDNDRFHFVEGNICNQDFLMTCFEEFRPCGVFHLAAESHVDNSIASPGVFIQNNIVGTYTMLQTSVDYLSKYPTPSFKFLHVSTDEVYGHLGDTGYFHEETPYSPNSPYSASKAASDHLVRAWNRTYKLPTITTNCSNNYGPWQYPEKLIPVVIYSALGGKPIPVYGTGVNTRDWLHVEDHANALICVFSEGRVGETYLIGGREEKTNITLVNSICSYLDLTHPKSNGSYKDLIQFVSDRPGHDYRYAIDPSKIEKELGWSPKHTFDKSLEKTIQWYIENDQWVKEMLQKKTNAPKT